MEDTILFTFLRSWLLEAPLLPRPSPAPAGGSAGQCSSFLVPNPPHLFVSLLNTKDKLLPRLQKTPRCVSSQTVFP